MIYLTSILGEYWWVIILGIFVFLYISRETRCWYWKINELIKLLTEIRDSLKNSK